MRHLAASYLLAFFLAVAIAPHRHLNSMEDLLSDGPSDSGIFVETPRGAVGLGPLVSTARLIDDDPCLACFHNDCVAAGPRDSAAGPQWSGARWRDDDPCLACFHHDFDSVTEVVAVFTLESGFGSLPLMWAPDHSTIPSIPLRSSDSRAPPAIA